MTNEWYGGTIENLERALLACPETSFIGHAPGFWRKISGSADEDTELYPSGAITPGGKLQKLFNAHSIYVDLSANSALGALKRDFEHAKQFIEQFSERLLFGRDYYGMDVFNLLEKLNLSQVAKDRFFYLNAQKLIP